MAVCISPVHLTSERNLGINSDKNCTLLKYTYKHINAIHDQERGSEAFHRIDISRIVYILDEECRYIFRFTGLIFFIRMKQ